MDMIQKFPHLGSIQMLTGSLAGQTFQINKPMITLGRDQSNDIVISDRSISRYHARLIWDNGSRWHIENLASQNIITVNQQEVQYGPVQDHDTIELGKSTSFLFLLNTGANHAHSAQTFPDQAPPLPPGPQQMILPPQSARPLSPAYPYPAASQPPSAPPLFSATAPSAGTDQPNYPDGTEIASFTEEFAPSHNTPGTPSLRISTHTHKDPQTYRLTLPVTNIGRNASNDIVINQSIVSSFHAQIVREGEQFVLIHPHPSRQKTLNGLLYQGQQIGADEHFRKTLKHGDLFRIGDENGSLVTFTFDDGSGKSQVVVPEIRPIPLGAAVVTIGRLPDNMVVLPHPQVSGHHARLEQTQGTYRIVDQGSTNHVYVNAQRVTNQLLNPGDEIRIGPFKLTFTGTQLTQYDESNSIRIDALNLKKVGNKKVILINNISLVVPPRKFVAVVGGSGAGKSTLMDILNGLRPAQEGTVLYNGQDYYHNLAAFSTQLGYVPQEDIVHRDLTVERALYYAAKLRLPKDFTNKQIKQRIDEVLDEVEMRHRRTLLVSKLSGGQRKRVSIALELLAKPSVFFLDEPTSGLDPGLDRKMMFLLRKLADKGHTIILVTHATNNINACDYVCFLAQGGHLAYYGPPDEARAFFDKDDFAEIYGALEPTDADPDIPARAEERFQSSPAYQRYIAGPLQEGPARQAHFSQQTSEIKQPKRGNPWKQWLLLSQRYIELLKNDVGNLLLIILQAPVIGLILMFIAAPNVFGLPQVVSCPTRALLSDLTGPVVSNDCQRVADFLDTPQGQALLTQQHKSKDQALQEFIAPGSGADAQEILFIMSFAAVMFGCINAAREIVKEVPIYRRERTVNLGILPYMFSKIAVLGIVCLAQSAILVFFVNFSAPFVHSTFLPPLLEIYITLALTSLAGLMLGLAVSTVAPNTDRAMSFVPIVLIPQVIFSGVVFALNGTFNQVAGALFAMRWAVAGLGSTIGLHGDKLGEDNFSFCGTLFSTCSSSDAIIHLLLVWLALVLMILLLGCIIAFFLRRKDIRA